MLITTIQVTANYARTGVRQLLTAGLKGARVAFSFDSAWDGLSKTAVFRCNGVTKDVLDLDTECEIPPEVLAFPEQTLCAGVYGTNADGTEVIPTIWASLGQVYKSADPSGDTSTQASPEIWAQLQAQIDDLKANGTPSSGGGLPAVTKADNGKIAQVVDGKWAAADLWDSAENNPDNAPDLWEDIGYRDGYRIIPETITAGLAFGLDEYGWWGDTLYRSTMAANVYTPEQYPDGWEEQ